MNYKDQTKLIDILLNNIKANLPKLEKLIEDVNGHWVYEDAIYRAYHTSFKCYYIQGATNNIVAALEKLMPDRPLNAMFMRIIQDGTGKTFQLEHNKEWEKHTRPMMEAFFHARYMLEMAIKYGKQYEKAPESLKSGFAALLYLYGIR
jgi:hypothetical protein